MANNLIQLNGGNKSYGSQQLFAEASFSIDSGEHVGVIGPNGAGKSTLFRILIGQEQLDEGIITRARELSLGYLSQHDEWGDQETGNEYLERVCRIPLWQAKSVGRDLKVSEEIFERPILSLSGGYRMRIKLIGLLGQDPNLMLLDEPTNYLDLETTLLLEKFLQNYQGSFLLISHDREFLRRTTDHILEVEAGDITKYNGNIDDYFEQKELLRTQMSARLQSQAEKRKVVLDFVARFGASATKAKQAQSRLKSLQRMEKIEMKSLPVTATIQIPQPSHVGKTVIRLSDVDLGYSEKIILKNISLEINRGDHVAVVGLNGAGKSTLLKGIAGTIEPLQGVRELGFQVSLAIYNQHVIEVLNPNDTVLESMQSMAHVEVTKEEILAMAGSLLFTKNLMNKRVSVLSGGEKSRVALGRVLLRKAPFLLLDEPTNHLDFQTVEALTQALRKFEGTIITVSHDRGFISRVGTKILEVTGGKVHLYPGTYDEYVWSLQQRLEKYENSEDIDSGEQSGGNSGVANKKSERISLKESTKSAPSKPLQKQSKQTNTQIEKRLKQCEEKIKRLEEENNQLNEKMIAGTGNIKELAQRMAENSIMVQSLEHEWLQLHDGE